MYILENVYFCCVFGCTERETTENKQNLATFYMQITLNYFKNLRALC